LFDERLSPAFARPRAVILGCSDAILSTAERRFFAAANPVGFVLFRRNCQEPVQVGDLAAALRDTVGRPDAPVLIDQEGGRVARLRPPHWRRYPAAAEIASLPLQEATEAAWLGARLMADDLAALGVTVDCAPVLDVPVAGADPVIGDRAYGSDPATIARLGLAVCDGLLAGGVLPVIKHMPGHGRAQVDSHHALPRVEAERADLAVSDFVPFRALADTAWAMTAHVVFTAIDPTAPATLSPTIIGDVIRGEIGFGGVLVSDDLAMGALAGDLGERTRNALAAGCDLALHCNGNLDEMTAVADAASTISEVTLERLARGEALRRRSIKPFDRAKAEERFDALLDGRS
jgi:beta-N-acetylhexosaminidase